MLDKTGYFEFNPSAKKIHMDLESDDDDEGTDLDENRFFI